MISMYDMGLIFEITDLHEIDREHIRVDLSKEDPGLVSKNISGMFEIIVPLTTPVKDWLPTLNSALTEIIGE
tara:strand:+ start:4615 stop:4830 length:216 start_codon:yes stop_codon:yes gene_type:complete